MSWSKTSTLAPGHGKKVRIKTKHGEMGLTNLESEQLSGIVTESRRILQQVIGWVSWPTDRDRLNRHFGRYFLNPAPSMNDRNECVKCLEKTMNGINSKINIKVAPDDSAYGYVGFRTGAAGALRGVFSPRHNLGKRNGGIVSRGDIHLDRDVLDDRGLAIITFIHEATHKYASTADHGDSGYLDDDGLTFSAPGMTPAQALNNADSYAWFCYAMRYR